jgi:hypothetical protein
MSPRNFEPGKKRRAIEDQIVEQFRQVNFRQAHHAYLDDDDFWDFVFSWYDLVRYYEISRDQAIGAHMLELFAQCRHKFQNAATDRSLREERRSKAADAIRQMTYYVNRMVKEAERNGQHKEDDAPHGSLDWLPDDTPNPDLN